MAAANDHSGGGVRPRHPPRETEGVTKMPLAKGKGFFIIQTYIKLRSLDCDSFLTPKIQIFEI